ncbi:hypothetical protein RUM44_000756 [Polyplax serrata]|uniref:Uncharacterized protein n=1 Tax=Polyplax serrata TaxID=468196 RepID=A0ABR1B684_POLSC
MDTGFEGAHLSSDVGPLVRSKTENEHCFPNVTPQEKAAHQTEEYTNHGLRLALKHRILRPSKGF